MPSKKWHFFLNHRVQRLSTHFHHPIQIPRLALNNILRIALPSIISNITVPLLSLVDTVIVGHLGAASYIGAIAIGSLIFNMAYWLFGFLRMGTGGLTAQAHGAGQEAETHFTLFRSLGMATVLALLLIVCQLPLERLAFALIDGSEQVEALAAQYFRILIWGAPAVLMLYSFNGWFLGMQQAKVPMLIALVQNVVNIVASLCFVYLFHLKVEGVAWGTLLAQYTALGMALYIYRRQYRRSRPSALPSRWFKQQAFTHFFRINSDIFLRTFCLICVTTAFTSAGASQGELTLAANTLLMQFFVWFSYVMDGFAYAGEALGGHCLGANDRREFVRLTHRLFRYGTVLAAGFTLAYAAGGTTFLRLLTNDATVVDAATRFLPWVIAIPFVSMAAFLFDGLFIGTTATRAMLGSMAAATLLFFAVILPFQLTNPLLWTAFLLYLGCRGAVQALLFRKQLHKFPNNSK